MSVLVVRRPLVCLGNVSGSEFGCDGTGRLRRRLPTRVAAWKGSVQPGSGLLRRRRRGEGYGGAACRDVTDAERSSLTFTAYDLDVHLTPAQSQLAVHAGFTVRNSGKEPLARLVFQISSSLQWESFAMRSGGRVSPLPFAAQTIDTDADHTGKATEAVVTLPQPLEPGASLELTASIRAR